MSWKVGLQDTDFDPEIHGDVDFAFFSDEEEGEGHGKKKPPEKPPESGAAGGSEPPDITISGASPVPVKKRDLTNEASGVQKPPEYNYSDEDFESSGPDSESDDDIGNITEVSPLSSPNLSPFLPRRNKNPVAKHLHLQALKREEKLKVESESEDEPEPTKRDGMSMKALSDTLNEIENFKEKKHSKGHVPSSGSKPLHPQRPRRFNMSFSNDEVVRIDRDNQILLRKILQCHNRPGSFSIKSKRSVKAVSRLGSSRSLSNSKAVMRAREQSRIDYENFILLKKIQSARPSSEIEESLKNACASNGRTSKYQNSSASKERHHSMSSFPKPSRESNADVGWISW